MPIIKPNSPGLAWLAVEDPGDEYGPGELIACDYDQTAVVLESQRHFNRTGRNCRVFANRIEHHPEAYAKWLQWLELCRRCTWSDQSWTVSRRYWAVVNQSDGILFWSFFEQPARVFANLTGGGCRVVERLRERISYDAFLGTQTIIETDRLLLPGEGVAA